MLEEEQDEEKPQASPMFDSSKPLSIQIDNFDFGNLKEVSEEEEAAISGGGGSRNSWFGNNSTEIHQISEEKPTSTNNTISSNHNQELIIDSLSIIFELLHGTARATKFMASSWLNDLESFFGDQLDHDKAEKLLRSLSLAS